MKLQKILKLLITMGVLALLLYVVFKEPVGIIALIPGILLLMRIYE